MEWSREKTVILIQEYHKRRGLWDLTHEDYRKKDIKHKLLVEVQNCIGGGITITEVEKKFHTLRTQFQREINVMKKRDPYNSKWFAFKHLQFLNSPRACRSSKGRVRNEITEDGTVTTKYIIRESPPVDAEEMTDNVSAELHISDHDGTTIANEGTKEYITLQRVATTNTTNTNTNTSQENGSVISSASASRTHELEKLIEETTKDVEDIEDNKSNIPLRHIAVPIEQQRQRQQQQQQQQQQQPEPHQQHQQHHHHHGYGAAEMQIGNIPTSESHEVHHLQSMGDDIDTINIHASSEEEMAYHQSATSSGQVASSIGVTTVMANNNTTMHTIPARIIKIQRRDHPTPNEAVEPIYDTSSAGNLAVSHYGQSHHQQQATHHGNIQAAVLSPSATAATKRIYYDANGNPHTATILTTTTNNAGHAAAVNGASLTLLNATAAAAAAAAAATTTTTSTSVQSGSDSEIFSPINGKKQLRQNFSNSATNLVRDEFSIYGDYVACEMRTLKTREVLISLKHKINTAIFEASMAEIHK